MGWLTLKLNRKLRGPGTIRVRKGSGGKPEDKYWRDRLKDAATDGCCEIVKTESKKKEKGSDG